MSDTFDGVKSEYEVLKEFERFGEVPPKIIVTLTDRQCIVFDYSVDYDYRGSVKEMIVQFIRLARRTKRLASVAFSSEAWVAARSLEDPMLKLRAAEDPDKKELAFCITYDDRGERSVKTWDIIRKPNGKATLEPRPRIIEIQTWMDRAFLPAIGGFSEEEEQEAAKQFDEMLRRARQ